MCIYVYLMSIYVWIKWAKVVCVYRYTYNISIASGVILTGCVTADNNKIQYGSYHLATHTHADKVLYSDWMIYARIFVCAYNVNIRPEIITFSLFNRVIYRSKMSKLQTHSNYVIQNGLKNKKKKNVGWTHYLREFSIYGRYFSIHICKWTCIHVVNTLCLYIVKQYCIASL